MMRLVALALLVLLTGSLPVKCLTGCVESMAPAPEHRCCVQSEGAAGSQRLGAAATDGDCCALLDGEVTAAAKAVLAPAVTSHAVALLAPPAVVVPSGDRPVSATASPPLILRI